MLSFLDLHIGYSKEQTWTFNENYTFNTGNIYALIGRNGAGKSTFLRTLAKQIPIQKGSIFLKGSSVEVLDFAALAKAIAVVRTDKINIAYTSVREMLAYGRMPHTNHWGQLKAHDWLKVQEVLDFLQLNKLANKQFAACSDGEQQLVLFGRALVQDTPIILLDEITSHLDFINRQLVFQYLKVLAEEQNKLIFIATHELPLALEYSHSILLFSEQKQISLYQKEELNLEKILSLW